MKTLLKWVYWARVYLAIVVILAFTEIFPEISLFECAFWSVIFVWAVRSIRE